MKNFALNDSEEEALPRDRRGMEQHSVRKSLEDLVKSQRNLQLFWQLIDYIASYQDDDAAPE